MPLVAPLPIEATPELAALADLFQKTLGFTPNSVLTMQHRPAVARAFIALNAAVMENHGRVTAELKRLIAHVCSANTGCRYCQAHTAVAALRFGGTADRVDAVWEFETSALFTPAERAALRFALAASSVPNGMTDEIGAEMTAHWEDGEIVEILGVISLFGFLNRWNDSMGTTLEAPAVEEARELLSGRGWELGKHG